MSKVSNEPVRDDLRDLQRWADQVAPTDRLELDFTDTRIAFEAKSDAELGKAIWLFRLMNQPVLVDLGSKLGLLALKLHLPFTKRAIRATIFEQFCGGATLLETQRTVDQLGQYRVATILDYGAEAKETEADLDVTRQEIEKAIQFAAHNDHVPVVSAKVSGLAPNALLEAVQRGDRLDAEQTRRWTRVNERLHALCETARTARVGVFFDAEESWIQDAIDELVEGLMARYNREEVIVYTTCQLYRHDRLAYLKAAHQRALEGGYLFGVKIVRGAYMDKERERAAEGGYPSPIQPDRAATDRDFNAAVRYLVEHYETIASCNASHNVDSNRLQAELIHAAGIPKQHKHLNFCQLYGMSDHITFNLAAAGYNVAKYVPYGPVREVVPYLIRRAEENSSVTGDMSRELKLLVEERARRGA